MLATTLDRQRRLLAHRRRRIIVNNDGDDAIRAVRPEDRRQGLTFWTGDLREDYLETRTSALAGTQVDSIFYSSCAAGLSFSHRTKIGHFLDRKTAPRCLSEDLIERYGRDTLGVQVDFCRRNGLEIFWSLRMNDRHDSYPAGSRRWTYGLAPFKRDHPEWVFGVPEDWERYRDHRTKQLWSGVDYARPEVREHIFQLIREVCEGYDVDGVELDFLRHPPFFRPGLDGEPARETHRDAMTDLLGRIREMADAVGRRRGRPILVAARLPLSLESSAFHGLDVRRWLDARLLDLIVAAGDDNADARLLSSIRELVVLGHRHETPVYACLSWGFWSYWAFLESGYDTLEGWRKASGSHWQATDSWAGMLPAWRGAALGAWGAGADGIYTFNVWEPRHRLFREVGDPGALTELDAVYGASQFNGRERALAIEERKSAGVSLEIGRDVRERSVSEVRLRAHVLGWTGREGLRLRLNGVSLDHRAAAGASASNAAGQWLECLLDRRQVKVGENRFEATLERAPSTPRPVLLDGLLLEVRHGR